MTTLTKSLRMLALEQELEVVAQLNEHNSKLKAIYFVMKHCNIDSKVEAHRIVTDIIEKFDVKL